MAYTKEERREYVKKNRAAYAEYSRKSRYKKKLLRDIEESKKNDDWMGRFNIPTDYTDKEKTQMIKDETQRLYLLGNDVELLFIGKASHEKLCKITRTLP